MTNENIIDLTEISIFPVPTSNYLKILYLGEDQLSKVMLFDLNGRKIVKKEV